MEESDNHSVVTNNKGGMGDRAFILQRQILPYLQLN